jgi:hypothetical protein
MTLGGLGMLSYVLIFTIFEMAFISSSVWSLGSSAAVDERSNEAGATYFKELGAINNQQ